MLSRTLWSCGLIHHVLDQKVEGSNFIAAKIFYNSNPQKISLRKSEQKKKGTLSLIASVRAVAGGEEEGMRRRRRGGIIWSIMWWCHLTVFVTNASSNYSLAYSNLTFTLDLGLEPLSWNLLKTGLVSGLIFQVSLKIVICHAENKFWFSQNK